LQSEPELFRGPEKFRQTDSGVGTDPTLLQNNVIDSRSRNPEGFGEPVGRKLQRLQELLAQDLTGVNFPVGSAFSFNRHYAAPIPISLTLFHPWIPYAAFWCCSPAWRWCRRLRKNSTSVTIPPTTARPIRVSNAGM